MSIQYDNYKYYRKPKRGRLSATVLNRWDVFRKHGNVWEKQQGKDNWVMQTGIPHNVKKFSFENLFLDAI
jgi:hypothetical protein